ncbi:MAG: hypothetical protein ACOY31_10870 [Bacillota bacterium]
MMDRQEGFELELSEETEEKLREYARMVGGTEDDVFEYIITQYLNRQLKVIEKRSADTGVPFGELLNMQFVQLLEFLMRRDSNDKKTAGN